MDFSLTEEQQMFKTMVRDFAVKEIEPVASKLDEEEKFPAETVAKMAGLGFLGVGFPEEYGGSGGTAVHYAILIEEISRACAGHGVILAAHLSLACYPIYRFGNEEQKKKYLPPMLHGEKIGCFGLTEPGAGSDAGALQTMYKKQDSSYVLNGNKIFITNGAEASVAVVCATEDKSLGNRGISAFIVEKEAPGFSVGKKEKKLGIRASSTAELVFDNCRIPLENMLGERGKGLRVALDTIDTGRIGIAAQAIGIAQGALDASVKFAKERQQFGKPISEFQAIQWMLVDMAVGIETARLITYKAAYLKDSGQQFMRESAMAKLYASEVAMAVTTKAIQVHGGYGYVKDYPVEKYFRDAKITEIYEGTSEMQRMTIARILLRD